MTANADREDEAGVLRSKRNATRYQILVEIAERQPAVSQQEIAGEIGITAQAVSDYLQDLVEQGHVEKHGRGRYEVTNEGVDWLISRTDDLREFIRHVSEDVIGEVEVDAAIATGPITEGDRVSLSMREGNLCATPDAADGTTAVAVTDAGEGQDVGVTDFEGVIDYEWGAVTVISVPGIQHGGSRAVPAEAITSRAGDADLLSVAGYEALAAVESAGLEPDLRFGTPAAVREAATRGLEVVLVAVANRVSEHTDQFREQNVGYEVVEVGDH